MPNIDFAVYTMHTAFWVTFAIGRLVHLLLDRNKPSAPEADQTSRRELTARFSRTLVMVHGLAFMAMYIGLGRAVIPNRVPIWFPGQRLAGAIVIESGAVLAAWAVATFRSWRVRAKLERSHELMTSGPFRFLRHPIYMGLNMLALGTAIWVPAPVVWAAVVLMAIGSDLRARAEERLLDQAFGLSYREYIKRTRRFIPGVY